MASETVNAHFSICSDEPSTGAEVMMSKRQLALFEEGKNLNIESEIKRRIRIALSNTHLSRDQVADEMNRLAQRDGMQNSKRYNRATLDGWCKDSDKSRMPGISGLVLFCAVLGTADPIRAMLLPLGSDAINPEDVALLSWAKAEQERRRAAKRARLAAEMLEM